MIKLLAFDVDGTISSGGNTMTKTLLSKLNQLQKQGIHIVLATGRSYADLYAFQEKNQFFEPSIILNGAAISDKNGSIHDCVYIDEKDVEAICTVFDQFKLPYVCYTRNQILDLSNQENNYQEIMKNMEFPQNNI